VFSHRRILNLQFPYRELRNHSPPPMTFHFPLATHPSEISWKGLYGSPRHFIRDRVVLCWLLFAEPGFLGNQSLRVGASFFTLLPPRGLRGSDAGTSQTVGGLRKGVFTTLFSLSLTGPITRKRFSSCGSPLAPPPPFMKVVKV